MICFQHPSVTAVGICKVCSKGLCHECGEDLTFAIVCSQVCAGVAVKQSSLAKRTFDMYGIGVEKKRAPLAPLMFGAMSVIFAIITYGQAGSDFNRLALGLMSALFLVFALWMFIRGRKIGLNM